MCSDLANWAQETFSNKNSDQARHFTRKIAIFTPFTGISIKIPTPSFITPPRINKYHFRTMHLTETSENKAKHDTVWLVPRKNIAQNMLEYYWDASKNHKNWFEQYAWKAEFSPQVRHFYQKDSMPIWISTTFTWFRRQWPYFDHLRGRRNI